MVKTEMKLQKISQTPFPKIYDLSTANRLGRKRENVTRYRFRESTLKYKKVVHVSKEIVSHSNITENNSQRSKLSQEKHVEKEMKLKKEKSFTRREVTEITTKGSLVKNLNGEKVLCTSSVNQKNVIEEFEEGDVVWAKLSGSPWWPAIIVDHRLFKMEQPTESEKWVYWYGDYNVSKLSLENLDHFRSSFLKRFHRKKGGNYKKAVAEACKEYARKSKVNITDWDIDRCILWAVNEFPDLDQSLVESSEAVSALPSTIIERLKEIADKNEKRGINQALIYTFEVTRNTQNLNVIKGNLNIQEMCLACYTMKNEESTFYEHPLFDGALCEPCKERLKITFFTYEIDGNYIYCSICGSNSKSNMVCSMVDCRRLYCHHCIEAFGGKITNTEDWLCFLCNDTLEKNLLLKKRDLWRINILKLYQDPSEKEPDYLSSENFPRRKLRVLSLFDGIATGLYALTKLGLEVEAYFASEIDDDAIQVAKWNFKNKITFLGDVRNITRSTLKSISPIHLLIGGSPCNDLSFVNPRRKGLYDVTGTGYLFFEYNRIKEMLESIQNTHLFFLFENVTHMPVKYINHISSCLGCTPAMIDAQYFTAAHRARFFWSNVPGIKTLSRPEKSPFLQDKLAEGFGRLATTKKLLTITTNMNSLRRDAYGPTPIKMDGVDVVPWVTEMESIFGFPYHYTDTGGLSLQRRRQLLGKAWSVDVIINILKPLCSFFIKKTGTSIPQ